MIACHYQRLPPVKVQGYKKLLLQKQFRFSLSITTLSNYYYFTQEHNQHFFHFWIPKITDRDSWQRRSTKWLALNESGMRPEDMNSGSSACDWNWLADIVVDGVNDNRLGGIAGHNSRLVLSDAPTSPTPSPAKCSTQEWGSSTIMTPHLELTNCQSEGAKEL